MQSESIKNLATALSKFQSEVMGASKSSDNPFFKSKYADLAEIWNTIKEPLTVNGLSVVQTNSESPTIITKDLSGVEKAQFTITVVTTLLHSSGEWINGCLMLPILKPDPQMAGSAITYARRYALAGILGIYQEDDDGNAHRYESKPSKTVADNMVLVERWKSVEKKLDYLARNAIDGFNVPKRVKDSLIKHLGVDDCRKCEDVNLLNEYIEHLTDVFNDSKKPKETTPSIASEKARILAWLNVQPMPEDDILTYQLKIETATTIDEVVSIENEIQGRL